MFGQAPQTWMGGCVRTGFAEDRWDLGRRKKIIAVAVNPAAQAREVRLTVMSCANNPIHFDSPLPERGSRTAIGAASTQNVKNPASARASQNSPAWIRKSV